MLCPWLWMTSVPAGPWWSHQMETFTALLALCVGNSPVTGEFLSQRPVTGSCDVFFDLAWRNSWVNNWDAGDLRCHRAHYDVTVMPPLTCCRCPLCQVSKKWKRLHNATEDVFLWHLKMTHYAAQMTSASSWQGAASHCQLNLAMPDQGLRPCCLYVMGCPNLIVAVDNAPLVIPLGDWSLNDIPNSCLLCLKEKTLPFR